MFRIVTAAMASRYVLTAGYIIEHLAEAASLSCAQCGDDIYDEPFYCVVCKKTFCTAWTKDDERYDEDGDIEECCVVKHIRQAHPSEIKRLEATLP